MLISGRYAVEVRLFGYDNPTQKCQDCRDGQFADPGCCDDFQALTCPNTDQRCDSFFFYCLRTLNSQMERNCSYFGSRTSAVNTDDGALNFSQSVVLGLENPLQLQGLTDAYNVSCYLFKTDNKDSFKLKFLLHLVWKEPSHRDAFFLSYCL